MEMNLETGMRMDMIAKMGLRTGKIYVANPNEHVTTGVTLKREDADEHACYYEGWNQQCMHASLPVASTIPVSCSSSSPHPFGLSF